MKYKEGSRVCTVARDGARMAGVNKGTAYLAFPIWTGAIYEARARKADGVLTWRKVGTFGGTRTGSPHPSPSFVAELQDDAPHPWLDFVRNGQRVHVEDTKDRDKNRTAEPVTTA